MVSTVDISKEIWMRIGQYLPLTDKAAASRVSKAWSEVFRTQMYRSLSLRRRDNNRDDDWSLGRGEDDDDYDDEEDEEAERRRSLKVLMPPKETVYKYRASIQDLKLDFPSPFLNNATIFATPGLKRLLVNSSKNAAETPEALAILDPLLTSPGLKNIEVHGFKLKGVMYILERVQHVESVSFNMCDFTGIEAAFKKAKLDLRIKKLDLRLNQGMGFQDLINWIGHFRHLDTLGLDHPPDNISDDAIIFPEKAPKINMSALSKLTGLNILAVSGPMLWGDQLAKMLKNCPKVTNLSLFNQTLYDDGFLAMAELFPHLTTLNMVGCDRVRVWMIKMILDSCPRMLHLVCPQFDLEYLPNPKAYSYVGPAGMSRNSASAWPCTGLKTLVLQDVTWSSKPSHLKWFMKQIGSLKNLEVFQMQYVDREEEELKAVLPGSVRSTGKDLKVTLKEGHFLRNDLEKTKALKWVLDVWPNMKMFTIMP
ncbi:hypothetical protein EMPS_06511 [Entomortierella parvispora]|uniref:F-box domain-containing protein n=1 Tax=Entomortierella parvispora TaxID=205924 RepID=A0A9P3LXJ0_9FUNG|nr:hypothetical protein EMPS_06511 [Entomortierella parvispora]